MIFLNLAVDIMRRFFLQERSVAQERSLLETRKEKALDALKVNRNCSRMRESCAARPLENWICGVGWRWWEELICYVEGGCVTGLYLDDQSRVAKHGGAMIERKYDGL